MLERGFSQIVRKSAGYFFAIITGCGPNPAGRQLLIVGLAPLYVLGTSVRAQEAPAAPAGEVTTPAQAPADPAKKKEAPAAEVPAPAGDGSAATAEKPSTVNDQTAPADQTTGPAPEATAPAADAVASTPPESAPAPEANGTSPEAVPPASENVATVPPDVSAPAPDATAPVADNTITAPAEAAPAPEPVAPPAEPAAPAPENITQVAELAPAPVKEEVAPVAETTPPEPAPATEPVAPAAEAVMPIAPAADTIIVAPTEIAPAPEGVAVTPEASVPAPDLPAAATGAPALTADTAPAFPYESAPVSQSAAPTAAAPETVPPVAQEQVPVREAPSAIRGEPAQVAETTTTPPPESNPAADTTAPSPETVTPPAETVTQVAAETPAPITDTPAPGVETPALAADAVPAVQVETLPAPESATPAPEAVTPPAEEAVVQIPTDAPTAGQEPAAPVPAVGSGVAVDRFAFSYGLAHPALPTVDELNTMPFPVARDGNVFRGPATEGAENLTLGNIPVGSRFDADALRTVAQEVVRWYNNRGLYGVWVTYRDIEASAAGLVDNRPLDDARVAHLVIWASQISDVRTLARGKRIKPQFSINNRKHRGIVKRSPLRPGSSLEQPGSLFNQQVLNDYLYGLSLHPGRRVEASIASAGEPGKVVLDYLVNESKTWQLFGQANNYGTESTGDIRIRVGFQHNQLTNHDDILNFDVISTPDFKTYGSFLSYRLPLWRPNKLLVRIYGSYGDFLTLDGPDLFELRYAGQNWLGGIEFMNRSTLWRGWQMQTVLGANFNHYSIDQSFIGKNAAGEDTASQVSAGISEFLIPFVGVNLARDFRWGGVSGGVRYEKTVGDYANKDTTTGVDALGRRDVAAEWSSLRWNLNGTVFLEPLFRRSAQNQTLAHEVSVRLKGRVLPGGERLIPQEQEPLGGAISVRGYPESVVSADEFIAGTIEYAYHLPRARKPGDEGKLFGRPFRWRPKMAGMNADWDLVFRAFFDYANRSVTPEPDAIVPAAGEERPFADRNLSIAGTGVGIGLFVKQNFSLRADFGMALTELKDEDRLEDEQIITAKGNKQIYLLSNFTW